MFAVPPPFSVASVGPVETSKVMVSLMSRPSMARLRTRLGFLMISVVMVPALTKLFGGVSSGRELVVIFGCIRLEILRDPWSVGVVDVHGSEGYLVGDASDGEWCCVENREGGWFRLATQCCRGFGWRKGLRVDCSTVGDGSHAYNTRLVLRARRCRDVEPHSGFKVDVDRIGSIASPSDGVGHILNRLKVGKATEEDVTLAVEVQATVGDLANRSSKGQLLRCQVQFQYVVVHAF